MQLVQCSKGHFYDSALGQCPQCAEEARNGSSGFTGLDLGADAPTFFPGSSAGQKSDTVGATIPADNGGDIGRTEPVNRPFSSPNPGPTVGVTTPGFTTTDFAGPSSGPSYDVYQDSLRHGTNGSRTGGWVVDEISQTQAVSINGENGFDPIVGWLVCVSGPNRGKDYRLHSGTNFIGSDKKMDVCIENDHTISRRNAASISYDDQEKVFFVQRGDGRNLIYLNGKAVRNDADLVIYDQIKIGETELVFVPLCCDKFTWQDM